MSRAKTMKRLWCWMLLSVACALPAAAQNLTLKVGGGLASHYKDSRPVGAFKLGLGYEFELDQHWTVEPSLVFYGKGWKEPDEQVAIRDDEGEQIYDEEGNPLVGVRSTSATANYIELPVVVHYYIRTNDNQYVNLYTGPYVACGVSGKIKTRGDADRPGSEKLYYDAKTFSLDGVRRFDAGWQVGAGYQFSRNFTLSLEGDFSLSRFRSGGDHNVAPLLGDELRQHRNAEDDGLRVGDRDDHALDELRPHALGLLVFGVLQKPRGPAGVLEKALEAKVEKVAGADGLDERKEFGACGNHDAEARDGNDEKKHDARGKPRAAGHGLLPAVLKAQRHRQHRAQPRRENVGGAGDQKQRKKLFVEHDESVGRKVCAAAPALRRKERLERAYFRR